MRLSEPGHRQVAELGSLRPMSIWSALNVTLLAAMENKLSRLYLIF
jgi:hypothetical protein